MEIKENSLLAEFTTLKVGGPARFFAEAENEEEISAAVKFAAEKNLPVFVLGGGSNILTSDKGFDGLVIKIQDTKYKILDTNIECGAGVPLSRAVSESIKAGLTGLEWAAGIPGTVGGAVRGNAGAFGGCMADVVSAVKVLDIKEIGTGSREELGIVNYEFGGCMFDYRDSVFKQNPNLIILSVTLKLKKGDKEESEKRVKEILRGRKEAQPFDFPSSGSFFKNPLVENKKLIDEYKKDTGKDAKDKIIPAGYIVDALGLRGKKIGGAMVSQRHGNFLVNAGGAKAEDFIILAALIKTRARNTYGVQLKEEVQMVGF